MKSLDSKDISQKGTAQSPSKHKRQAAVTSQGTYSRNLLTATQAEQAQNTHYPQSKSRTVEMAQLVKYLFTNTQI